MPVGAKVPCILHLGKSLLLDKRDGWASELSWIWQCTENLCLVLDGTILLIEVSFLYYKFHCRGRVPATHWVRGWLDLKSCSEYVCVQKYSDLYW
jgi:hypothetical protein